MDATNWKRDNIYFFWWNGAKITVKPTTQQTTPKPAGKPFLSIVYSCSEFYADLRESRESYALVVKGKVQVDRETLVIMQLLFQKFAKNYS